MSWQKREFATSIDRSGGSVFKNRNKAPRRSPRRAPAPEPPAATLETAAELVKVKTQQFTNDIRDRMAKGAATC